MSFTSSVPSDWAEQLEAARSGRQQAEAALHTTQALLAACEARLAALEQHGHDAHPHPVLRLSAAGEVLYANSAAGPLLRALAASGSGSGRQHLLALGQESGRQSGEPRELTVGRQHYLLRATAAPDGAGLVLYLTEVTGPYSPPGQHKEPPRFYADILNQLPVYVIVLDAEYRYRYISANVEPDAALREWMLGKTSAETVLRRHRPPAVLAQRTRLLEQAVRERREVEWEETIPDATGVRHWRRRVLPVWHPDGTLRHLVSSGVDITDRKQIEGKFSQQQEFYESILNLLPVDVAVFDAEHRYLFANPASIADPTVRGQILGMTNAEYGAFLPLPAPLVEQREEHFARAAATRTDVTWVETRPGPQYILRHLRPVFHPDGTLRWMVDAGLDITFRYDAEERQRQTESLMREQQAFIRLIVDTLPEVLYVSEGDGTISFTNAAYDTLATHLQEDGLHYPQTRARLRTWDEQVLVTRTPLTEELPLPLPSGSTHYFQVHKRPLVRASGKLGVLTISTDITFLKQAQKALMRRKKQYYDLVYYSQALICTYDLAGVILSVNPAIERLMGVPGDQLVGRDLRASVPAEHLEALEQYLASPMLAPAPSIVTIRTGTGEKRYLHYYTYRVEEDGYPPYVVASGYDVTSRVFAERALRQAKQEAEENAHAKEAFLSRMSHEIRTPLNGVLGMASLLKKTALTEQQHEYLRTMEQAGQHLLALVNDVLDMAKITAQQLELDQTPFDLDVALQGAGQMVAALAEQKGLQLIVHPLPLADPRVVGDAYRLQQVLLNLLSNALKFTDQGRVELGVELVSNGLGALTLRFWVQDTGIGIAPEQQARIFDAFTQANPAVSRPYGGTGLGLAISQQLVRQMGGTLTVRSVPAQGTTFDFTLTLSRPPAAPAVAPLQPAEFTYHELRGLQVLLAEDNLVNQWISIVLLEYWGVHVHAVATGTEALAALQANHYDAALLDIQMPGLSGVEVTTAIRQHPDAARARLPIIAVTANAFEADQAEYRAAGMDACVTKPFEEASLCRLLLQLTGRGSA